MSPIVNAPLAWTTSSFEVWLDRFVDVCIFPPPRFRRSWAQSRADAPSREPSKPNAKAAFGFDDRLERCSLGAVQRTAIEDSGGVRPILKWAGGKRQLLPPLLARTPSNLGTYFEPFFGGGALFFALCPPRAVLADANERLVRTYRAVRDDVDAVITLLKTYRHEPEFFYAMRALDIDGCSDCEVAAWVIYLNKVAYNGLYRVNSKNRFNVPFGRYENPTICNEEGLRACARALCGAELANMDFEVAVQSAKGGDFVYFDPPYVPISGTSSFTSYTSGGFGPNDQVRLRDVARDLKRRGVTVLLSNSAAPEVRSLYSEGFEVTEVSAARSVNSHGGRRGPVAELIIR